MQSRRQGTKVFIKLELI